VLHQRGVSGIDGLLAGAVGTRLAAPRERPVALLYGDVSALHDVGSFASLGALAAEARGALVVVVVDNGGGRIFEELPIARVPSLEGAMRELFLTPPPRFVEAVVRAFGIEHRAVGEPGALRAAIEEGLALDVPLVIEARVDPTEGARVRRAIASRPERGVQAERSPARDA
jgi:2-succinyl-5-enolpyruvyl-6-hydroxy-3-cyclohexene-1-carboxylate synthase